MQEDPSYTTFDDATGVDTRGPGGETLLAPDLRTSGTVQWRGTDDMCIMIVFYYVFLASGSCQNYNSQQQFDSSPSIIVFFFRVLLLPSRRIFNRSEEQDMPISQKTVDFCRLPRQMLCSSGCYHDTDGAKASHQTPLMLMQESDLGYPTTVLCLSVQ